MTYSDDRRYMTFEMRAAEGDERFVITADKRAEAEAKAAAKRTAKRREDEAKAAAKTAATCTVCVGGGKCGKPAVAVFKASSGDTFAECAEHAI